ncbi:MAG: hypothetical protein WA622_29865 [Mycobacterium sp.]|uniref:hypothetical protein n=1 Tax=Mycobacterium sp. TaxID=1785 RepID=UPI003C87A746
MVIREPALPEPVDRPNAVNRLLGRINPKRLLNHFAAKALKSADVVLGSMPIPGVEVVKEIKEVAEIAITD